MLAQPPPGRPTDGFPFAKDLRRSRHHHAEQRFPFWQPVFKQTNSTAMGTPCACSYATIYYSYHKETVLLQPDIAPIFNRRLIDNAYIFQRNTPQGYTNFMQAMNSFCQEGANLNGSPQDPDVQSIFLRWWWQFPKLWRWQKRINWKPCQSRSQ
jgi:hypothetical protein